MIVYNLTHWDLDGVVSNIVVENALSQFAAKVVTIPTTYEDKDVKLLNILEMAAYEGEPYWIVITDLNLDNEYLERALNDKNLKKMLYLDHHPRDGRGELKDLAKDYKGIFAYSFTKDFCGAKIALEFFEEAPLINLSDDIHELVRLTDIYDCWRIKHPDFQKKAYYLNDLFWNLKFDDFKKAFYNGYKLTDEHKEIIKKLNSERTSYLKETKEKYSTAFPLDNDDSLLFVHHPAGRFVNDMTIAFPTHQLYLIFKYQAKGLNIFSVRSGSKKYNVTELVGKLEKLFKGSEGGGHADAGGISVPVDVPLGEFFETFAETASKLGS